MTKQLHSRTGPTLLLSVGIALAILAPSSYAQAAYKCKSADGKIEYSDRPCDTSKSTLNAPGGMRADAGKPKVDGIAELQKIFSEFETPLCERERIAGEIDRATRSGELHANRRAWVAKQERLSNLNDQMAIFQERVSKITKPAGVDSAEVAAVRKFQRGLKSCDKPGAPANPPPKPAPNK